MTTISKFYLRDAATPNTGTMPTNSPTTQTGGVLGTGTEATGATTARDATDVAGTSNPDLESTITAQAVTTLQRLGHRRFVSRPLAARTFATADGSWAMDYAAFESNTSHTTLSNEGHRCQIYAWRPSSGAVVGALGPLLACPTPLTITEAHLTSFTSTWGTSTVIIDGDILVFDIFSQFTQGMATAYTDSFSYNGTTEASITTCASFVTPPVPLTLFTTSTPSDVIDTYVSRRITSRRGYRKVAV